MTDDRTRSFDLTNGLRTRFVDPHVERAYRKQIDHRALRYAAYVLPPTAISFPAVWWWDVQVNPAAADGTLWIRIAIGLCMLALLPLAIAQRDELLAAAGFVAFTLTYGGLLWILVRLQALDVGITATAINYMVMPLALTRQWQIVVHSVGWTAVAIGVSGIAQDGEALVHAVAWLPLYSLFAMIAWWFLDLVRRRIHAADGELALERERSEALLHNILPEPVATALKGSGRRIAHRADAASVLFVDLVGFTAFARDRDPDDVVDTLDTVFSDFDAIVLERGAEKIKTIGDGYLVVAGLPNPREDHADVCAHIATAMHERVAALGNRNGQPWQLRAGIHSGEVVAGVIGTHKFAYDIWGGTVNLASRLESNARPGRTQVSTETAALLKPTWNVSRARTIELKGHGSHRVHWLGERRNGQP